MSVNWIDTTKLSYRSLFLLERVQISSLKECALDRELAILLKTNPDLEWFFRHKCPNISSYLDGIKKLAPVDISSRKVHEVEQIILSKINDWLTYAVDPTIYDKQPFLGWDSNELLSLADFTGKIVIDIGSGTGRLAFLVTSSGKAVYAVEPIENLRSYIRHKAERMNVQNLYVLDGLITRIPFEDAFANVTMGGHVFGDCPEEESKEMERVTKRGGMIIYCPGNNDEDNHQHKSLLAQGYDWAKYEEPVDGWKRKYWKQKP